MSNESLHLGKQERILYIISKNPTISLEDISISCGIGSVEASALIEHLQMEKAIEGMEQHPPWKVNRQQFSKNIPKHHLSEIDYLIHHYLQKKQNALPADIATFLELPKSLVSDILFKHESRGLVTERDKNHYSSNLKTKIEKLHLISDPLIRPLESPRQVKVRKTREALFCLLLTIIVIAIFFYSLPFSPQTLSKKQLLLQLAQEKHEPLPKTINIEGQRIEYLQKKKKQWRKISRQCQSKWLKETPCLIAGKLLSQQEWKQIRISLDHPSSGTP